MCWVEGSFGASLGVVAAWERAWDRPAAACPAQCGPPPAAVLAVVRFEVGRGAVNRARGLLERGLRGKDEAGCAWLWRLYMDLEVCPLEF